MLFKLAEDEEYGLQYSYGVIFRDGNTSSRRS